ncbi:hypothetical protein [Waltera intestinalis]|uniref:hypothetical protein n=1 Tax=Waltera intestinalis TaxID=2606635 RepID=UPI0012B2E85C|nr:hypothetical protein [Waltera intestinalis]
MKKWNAPAMEELNINETAHNWTGIYSDGGYIGDGVISGHLSWDKPGQTNPDESTNQLS